MHLDSLKKEAKAWLRALRAGDPDARARFERALPRGAESPTLRAVQLALAREHGFAGWAALKRALTANDDETRQALADYDEMADALLDAYRTGSPEAMERHYRYTWHRRPWSGMRTYVQLDLGKRPAHPGGDVEITLDEARYLVAIEHGFASWSSLVTQTAARQAGIRAAAKPVHLYAHGDRDTSAPLATSRDWRVIVDRLREHPSARLHAEGEMTDEVLADVCGVETVTSLDLSGSKRLTDAGIRHLARLPGLTYLDLSGTAITDRGLEVLQHLPALEDLSLAMTAVTDEGMPHLAHCHAVRRVNLSWTATGDRALEALAGKRQLSELLSGAAVSDSGIPLLHDIPVFKTWHGGTTKMSLLGTRALPNHLLLRGSFTDRGMQQMRGLDGLFGLNLDDRALAISAAAIEPLTSLPHLGWLAVDAQDDWMPIVARMPHLRYFGAQDTVAGDEGFVALSRSPSIEYIWGRRCHNLRRQGFTALAGMPALRGLSVSCLNVDDVGVSALPSFPALRELMPMDVPDAGYRHVAACDRLESLILMYCRDTTDAATTHITRLPNLSYYFNSYTTITDRTPELLSAMSSLERITFDACHGLTNAGVARLARLPRLRELRMSGRQLTPDAAAAFSSHIDVRVGM
jgi:hypothetical protein